MKRSRDADDEYNEKLEEVQNIIDSLKKRQKSSISPNLELNFTKSEDEGGETQKKIVEAIGKVIDETPVEITYLPSGVKTYSFIIKYPNFINAKHRADILSIKNIVEGGIETVDKRTAKLTIVHCTDEKVALKMHSGSIGEKNKDIDEAIEPKDIDAKILREVESFIPFVKSEKPRTVINPCTDGVVQVIKGQKVISPVKFTQIDKIPNGKVIQDIEFGPSKDSNDLFMMIKYLKDV